MMGEPRVSEFNASLPKTPYSLVPLINWCK